MKTFKILVAQLVCVGLFAGHAQAGQYINGSIYLLQALPGAKAIVTLQGASHGGAPACATITSRFAFDHSTPTGRALYAALLTAYALKSRVNIHGNGTCVDWSDSETMWAVDMLTE